MMSMEGFRQNRLLVELSNDRRKRLDYVYNTGASDKHRIQIDEATAELWRARMPHVEIVLDGPMWRAIRQEVQYLRTCIESPEEFRSMLSRTRKELGHGDAGTSKRNEVTNEENRTTVKTK
jgi:hypothetical protein